MVQFQLLPWPRGNASRVGCVLRKCRDVRPMNRIRFSLLFDFSPLPNARTGWKIYPVYGEKERENGRSFRFATPNLSSPRKLGKASFVTLFASYSPFDPCSWNYIRIRYITERSERKREEY